MDRRFDSREAILWCLRSDGFTGTSIAAIYKEYVLRSYIAAARRDRGTPLLPRTPVTVSNGVSELDAADTVYAWINRADTALYAARHKT